MSVAPTLPAATALASAAVAGTATSTVSDNIKYVIVGIDNQTGSINYIKDDSDTIVDSANKERPPYSIFEEPSNSDSITYVKFKVKKSSTQPIQNSNDRTPYFELNKSWYTLLLDQHVSPRETSGIVTKEWFGTGLDKDPFSIFKRWFYNTELVLKNLKYLFNLPPEDSNFNKVFPEIDQSKDGNFEEIQQALIRPFFAIKTFLDMKSSRTVTNNIGERVELFFTSGRKRYGYPNINGDKSKIISALQMLYDIRNRCPECVSHVLDKLLTHIYAQHYFLKKDENEDNIGDFERDINTLLKTTFDAKTFGVLDFLKSYTTPTAAVATTPSPGTTPPSIEVYNTLPDDLSRLTKNLVIIESDKPLPKSIEGKGYKLVGEISELRDLNQFVYTNFEEKSIYNDVEIRLLDGSSLQYLAGPKKISLYRKLGSTFRELLEQKYNISKSDIERTLRGNRFINFIDYFLSDNVFENNKHIENFMSQYLSDQSKMDLEKLINTKFNGLTFRHGICNYSGTLSYFTAAMQLAYDCCLYKSGIDYNKNIFSTDGKVSADVRMAEFELKNIEYCLERVFENIQTSLKQREYSDPTKITTDATPSVPAENYFYNYRICADFIVNANSPYSKMIFPKEGNGGLKFFEFLTKNLVNNYFYRRYAYNMLDYDPNVGFITAVTAGVQLSNKYFVGKYFSYLAEPVKYLADIVNTPEAQIASGLAEELKKFREHKQKSLYNVQEFRKFAEQKLIEDIKKKITGLSDLSNRSLPLILSNDCVKIIHQLILVLFKNFNVFIDFEDDLREQPKKIAEFKNDTDIQIPNFVIKIGSLPREAVDPAENAPPGASTPPAPALERRNCIKITGFPEDNDNAEYANGVYYPYDLPDGTKVYKHSDHNKIYLKKETTTWQIYFDGTAPAAADVVIATSGTDNIFTGTNWNLKNMIYSNNTNTDTSLKTGIKSEYIGAPYIPQPGEPVTITPVLPTLAPTYTWDTTTQYETLGTIYKSIHHDFVYKYYNHEHKILFNDCRADYDVEEPKLNTMTAGMFPFIRLYKKRVGYTYPNLTDAIYADAITWSELPKP
jgi:hypothetical protein